MTQLLVGENSDKELSLAITEQESKFNLLKINKECFQKEGEEVVSSIATLDNEVSSAILKPDLSGVYCANNKQISFWDLEKGALSS